MKIRYIYCVALFQSAETSFRSWPRDRNVIQFGVISIIDKSEKQLLMVKTLHILCIRFDEICVMKNTTSGTV